jgi:hypothetical protein
MGIASRELQHCNAATVFVKIFRKEKILQKNEKFLVKYS